MVATTTLIIKCLKIIAINSSFFNLRDIQPKVLSNNNKDHDGGDDDDKNNNNNNDNNNNNNNEAT